ncbi:Fic family protein [Rhizobium sp. R711]|uniref:Fic family protein n=1 Tax=unclassified Rhizobium TaxID=2613769 RepID=UPI0032AF60B8
MARGKAPGLVPGHVQPFGDRGHAQGAPAGRLPIAQCLPAGLVACPFAATCVSDEPDARIKAIVAPFLFTYIHPLPDGNGRTARFIMNALLAVDGHSCCAQRRVHECPGRSEPTRKYRASQQYVGAGG